MRRKTIYIIVFIVLLAATLFIIYKPFTPQKAEFAPVETKKFALLVGISTRNPGMSKDIQNMETLVKRAGVESNDITILTRSNDATVGNVLSQLQSYADNLKDGDYLYLYFTGHGGQVYDSNHDEAAIHPGDTLDETILLYDGQLVDDELFNKFAGFSKKVNIVFIADCCDGGTLPALTGEKSINNDFNLAEGLDISKLNAQIIYLGASLDGERAVSKPDGSVFTSALFGVCTQGASLNYYNTLQRVKANVKADQQPVYMELSSNGICEKINACNSADAQFRNQPAFRK
ncbi:caspase family protein [Mucilaginibacter segetis]|uniref:Caspase family protein n=1 Tax=Mucilaginibacter segetis TaxID=2793071 RepID=A0A934UP51_9SPHI|nr:caspase family protein [Mucilaginibacter segetis]MBK0380770.1 caspase family protein [Mucilaginibacter segetis]